MADINYIKRIKESFEAIIIIADGGKSKETMAKSIVRIAKAQLKNIDGLNNKLKNL